VIEFTEGLWDRLVKQEQVIEGLSLRVKALENQLAKDSHNSHKPPSSDGFRHFLKSLRAESGKRVGGQEGHEGKTLSFAERVDEVILHEVRKECRRCGASLARVSVSGYERRQVWDIPEIKMRVVEHRAEVKRCPGCGESIGGEFPEGITSPVQYGKKIRSITL
jgi:transposase